MDSLKMFPSPQSPGTAVTAGGTRRLYKWIVIEKTKNVYFLNIFGKNRACSTPPFAVCVCESDFPNCTGKINGKLN